MCGIAGMVYRDAGKKPAEETLQRMTRALSHRGPDAEKCWADGNAGLGHRRLSIIDLEGGTQPLENEDGSVRVVFNGEIYNYRELTRDLQAKGHRFKTHSDTETIVHLYEEEGAECVRKFRGMFSFALWDAKRRALVLARDPVGIKPLYYYLDGEKIAFASELKALLQIPGLSLKLNETALDSYFTYGCIVAPDTIYKNFFKLPPGHYGIYAGGKWEQKRYWDLAEDRDGVSNLSFSDAADQLRQKLEESVASHLVSDVPVGAFLSGGLDSSSVVAMMSRREPRPISTFSIGFENPDFDERRYAETVARHFGTEHHFKEVSVQPEEMLRKITALFDEPFADASAIPTYALSKMTREKVKVVLSGDGGDENFGGYRRYVVDSALARARRFAPAVLRPLFRGLGKIPVPRLSTALRQIGLEEGEAYFDSLSVLKPGEKRKLYQNSFRSALHGDPVFTQFLNHYDRLPGRDPLSRMIYTDVQTLLPDDYLTKVDRASMAHGLEVRVPMLDPEFLSFNFHLPSEYKLRGKGDKLLLRRAMEKILPQPILTRGKMGFEIPLTDWLRGALKPLVEAKLFQKDSFVSRYLDQNGIRRIWNAFLSRSYRNAYFIWTLLVLEMWHEDRPVV